MIFRLFLTLCLFWSGSALAQPFKVNDWSSVLKQAKGETVYLNAWGGDPNVNSYLQWAAKQIQKKYDVKLIQVKVANIAETTQQLLIEKHAGKNYHGSVDMVWINGENFYQMKSNHLLYGPFAKQLPSWKYVDTALPVTEDFSVPTDGLEAPWGIGQLVFIYNKKQLTTPPKNFQQLLALAQAHPGQISYPQPPNFYGTGFLTSALLALTHDKAALSQPINPQIQKAKFDQVTAPLWAYLDKLNAVAWQGGQRFPANSAQTEQLLNDNQLLLAITFNPNSVPLAIENGNLPETAKVFTFTQGALSNAHFLAIPWNANAKAGSLVAINFLLSPEAQQHKSDTQVWGDPSILKPKYLGKKEAQGFHLFKPLKEPNPTWQSALNWAWQQHYGH
jgi:putative thiamine transport system substrate-binding protein